MVFVPGASHEQKDEDNDEPLFWSGQDENLFHRCA